MFSSIAIVIDDYDRMFSLTADPQDEKLHFEKCISRVHAYWTEEAKIPCEISIYSAHSGRTDVRDRLKRRLQILIFRLQAGLIEKINSK